MINFISTLFLPNYDCNDISSNLDNFVFVAQKNQLKFKMILTKELQSTQSNLPSFRIKLEADTKNKFQELKNIAINKFNAFGILKDNFDIFWQDEECDFNIITDEDNLLEALEELNGPLYKLFLLLQSRDNLGEYIIISIMSKG